MYTKDEIKELISILEESSLSLLEMQKEDGSKIKLEKPQQVIAQTVAQPAQQLFVQESTEKAPAQQPVKDCGKTIKAPIVGVFYSAPSPDSNAFVSVGKKVKKGDTVCIIEAMKCMNEIQSEADGEITEILANDGDLVEYGQPLYRIK